MGNVFRAFFFSAELLISGIQTPGQLVSQGLQEIVFVEPYQADGKLLAAYGELDLFIHDLFSGIQGTEELVRTAFDFKGDDFFVWHDDRSYIEVMWGNGVDYEAG